MLLIDEKPDLEALALQHHGIKGMKWGVRKEETSSGRTSSERQSDSFSNRHDRAKKIAIGVGVLAVVAGTAYVTYSLNKNGKLPLGSLKKATISKGSEEAKKILQQPTDIIHLARGKEKGLTFQRLGNTPDYFSVFDKLGMNEPSDQREFFKRAVDGSGNVMSRFADPRNYRDHAGRAIHHDVVIPRSMSDGVNSVDDVKEKIWPLLKDTYDAFWEASLKPRF